MAAGCCCRHSGTQSIACSYKAVTGYLYPLERGFIFVHKPPVHIRFDEVESVNFARSAGNTRSFDFDISTVTGSTYTFVGIEKWVTVGNIESLPFSSGQTAVKLSGAEAADRAQCAAPD